MPNHNRSLFVPVLAPFTRPVTGGVSVGPTINNNKSTTNNNMNGDPVIKTVRNVWDATPDNLKSQIKSHVKGEAIRQGQKVRDNVMNRSGRMRAGGGKGYAMPSGSRGHSSGYSLTKAPNPRVTNLDTGIIPNTFSPDYLVPELNKCSPLHMTSALFKFPVDVTFKMYSYFTNILAFDLQTKAQANVGFNLNVNTDFTAANILSAMNDLVTATQYYLYYMSIISYHSDPENKNDGMIYLRQQITAQIIEDLSVLGRLLADIPIPPKLLELLRYLSGNYLSGDNQSAALIKLYPFTPSSNLIDSTVIATSITSLTSATNVRIFSLMRRAIPQWSPKMIYDVEPKPVFDKQFLTIFANLPFVYWNGVNSVGYGPSVGSNDAARTYNTYTNELDGTAFALQSIYYSNKHYPGLITPVYTLGATTSANTRKSYYINGSGTKAFYNSDLDKFLSRSRQESIQVLDDTINTVDLHLFGADLCSSVSINTVNETTFKVLDYLMSAETIKIDIRKHLFGGAPEGSGGGRRSRRN